jgi:hypothetical protein
MNAYMQIILVGALNAALLFSVYLLGGILS